MKNIAILASGSGTNAQNIAEYFNNTQIAKVTLILSNNKNAFVIERAKNLSIPWYVFTREQFCNTEEIINLLKEYEIDLIVLAGFLWLIPTIYTTAFPQKIINIHPALLPKFGGKGMYGMNVHNAVLSNKEAESGISIHYVNEKYDEGKIIFQAKCNIDSTDTPESLALKIHELEYTYFPKVIEEVLVKKQEAGSREELLQE